MELKQKLSDIGKGAMGVIEKIGKKNLIIICSVLLCGLAVYLNFIIFANEDDIPYGASNMEDNYQNVDSDGAKDEGESYFASTQLNRTKARDAALEVLRTVVANENTIDSAKEQALSDIAEIAKQIEMEANVESLVESKGFSQCIAVISEGNISVIVGSDELLPAEVAQINEIVFEQTGIEPTGVKIIVKDVNA